MVKRVLKLQLKHSKQDTPRALSLLRTVLDGHGPIHSIAFLPEAKNIIPNTSQNTLDPHCYMPQCPNPIQPLHPKALEEIVVVAHPRVARLPLWGPSGLGGPQLSGTSTLSHNGQIQIYLSLRVKNLATLGMIQICINLYYRVPWPF